MRLTDEERVMLAGDAGFAARKAMEILVALGEIYEAEDLVEVRSVQIAGVSYHNLGEAGLEWLAEMAVDGRVRALTTLNPAGMDLQDWQRHGVDPAFAEQQLRVVRAYAAMGIATTCTCTPYLIGNLPAPGEHIAWAESSAVAYANSVLGARTNREGGPSALAAALTGRTPRYGLHLDHHRVPQVEVIVEQPLRDTAEWGALGHLIGKRGGGRVALLRLADRPGMPQLKSLGAALVTYGGSPLYYIDHVTPQPPWVPVALPPLTITRDDLEQALRDLADGDDAVDLVCLGCPHASLQELSEIAGLLRGQTVRSPLWISTARPTAEAARQLGLTETIEAAGAVLMSDTCFAVAPIDRAGQTVATDSVKGCFYGRGHNKLKIHLGSMERCVAAAIRGRWA